MRHYLFLFSSLLLAGFALVGCSNPAAGSSGSPPATTVPPTVVTPTVLSTSPLDTATAVVLNTRVSANFSEAMDSTTVTVTNFSLKQGSTPVVGSVAYSGTRRPSPRPALSVRTWSIRQRFPLGSRVRAESRWRRLRFGASPQAPLRT